MNDNTLNTNVYNYKIVKNDIASNGEKYLSELKLILPNEIYNILKSGCISLDATINDEKYNITISSSKTPGIPDFNLN